MRFLIGLLFCIAFGALSSFAKGFEVKQTFDHKGKLSFEKHYRVTVYGVDTLKIEYLTAPLQTEFYFEPVRLERRGVKIIKDVKTTGSKRAFRRARDGL